MTADKGGGPVVPCKPPRNRHRIRNPAIFTLISPSIQDSCLFSYLSFSTSYFSTPRGMSKQKKSFTLSEQDYHRSGGRNRDRPQTFIRREKGLAACGSVVVDACY